MQEDDKPMTDENGDTQKDKPADQTADMAADMADARIDESVDKDMGEIADDAAGEESLEDKLAAANDQLLRALAELENTRRRAERAEGGAYFESAHNRSPTDG